MRPLDREAFIAALTREGRVDRAEIEMKTATGRRLWARVSASLVEYRGERVVFGALMEEVARSRRPRKRSEPASRC